MYYKIKINMEMSEEVTIEADSKEQALQKIDTEREGIMVLTKSPYFKGISNIDISKIF